MAYLHGPYHGCLLKNIQFVGIKVGVVHNSAKEDNMSVCSRDRAMFCVAMSADCRLICGQIVLEQVPAWH